MIERIGRALDLLGGGRVARRYLVVNAFDGVFTMLGLDVGFLFGGDVGARTALSACVAAAVGLGMSGLSSAYVSEQAEQEADLKALEVAMHRDLGDAVHGDAVRWGPVAVSLVNGLSPFTAALLVTVPIGLAAFDVDLPVDPFLASIGVALGLLFVLGVYLGHIAGRSLVWGGLRAVLAGAVTVAVIWGVDA